MKRKFSTGVIIVRLQEKKRQDGQHLTIGLTAARGHLCKFHFNFTIFEPDFPSHLLPVTSEMFRIGYTQTGETNGIGLKNIFGSVHI